MVQVVPARSHAVCPLWARLLAILSKSITIAIAIVAVKSIADSDSDNGRQKYRDSDSDTDSDTFNGTMNMKSTDYRGKRGEGGGRRLLLAQLVN